MNVGLIMFDDDSFTEFSIYVEKSSVLDLQNIWQ